MAGLHKHGPGFVTCHCGKRGYFKRKQARTLAKRIYPGDHLNAYQCDRSGYWHMGHPKPGDRDRDRRRAGY